jgi:hypothetical protein
MGTISQASAQQRKTLFDLLFNDSQSRNERVSPAPERRTTAPVKQVKPATVPKLATKRPSAVVKIAPPPPDKLENARKILVVGDFMANGLAEGLETAFADLPGVLVTARGNGSSGFVRDDFYDWPGSIASIIGDEKPALVVMMIGSNDRQKIGRDDVLSEAWTKTYEARVAAFAKVVRDKKLPLVMVGMPAFKSRSMSSDMFAFNDIYKRTATVAGAEFVDIWDGFVDENGNFVRSGPDINGQVVSLRGSDGINLTSAGKRKVAFYAEKPLRRLLGNAVNPDIGTLSDENFSDMVLAPIGSPLPEVKSEPIAVNNPDLDGGDELLGANVRAPQQKLQPSLADKLLIRGIAPPPVPGRVDDFSWPRNDG